MTTAAAWQFQQPISWLHLGDRSVAIGKRWFSLIPEKGFIEAILMLGVISQKWDEAHGR